MYWWHWIKGGKVERIDACLARWRLIYIGFDEKDQRARTWAVWHTFSWKGYDARPDNIVKDTWWYWIIWIWFELFDLCVFGYIYWGLLQSANLINLPISPTSISANLINLPIWNVRLLKLANLCANFVPDWHEQIGRLARLARLANWQFGKLIKLVKTFWSILPTFANLCQLANLC